MPRTRNSTTAACEWADSDQATGTMVLDDPQSEDLAFYVRHQLSHEERLVVMLRYAEELEFDEIAGVVDLPQAEVELIHDKVVRRLKRAIKPDRRSQRCLAAAR